MQYHVIQTPFLPLMMCAQDPQKSADSNQINLFAQDFFMIEEALSAILDKQKPTRNSAGSHVLHDDHLSMVVLVSVSFFFHMDG